MNTLAPLLWQRARRDRWTLTYWILGTGLLALFAATAVRSEYGDDAARAGILRLAVAHPSILLLRGLPQGAGLDAFVFFQIFTYLALLAALMSTLLAVRHSRAEEETGRAELIASTRAARDSAAVATLVHGVAANVALGVAVAGGFALGGLALRGSIVTGLAAAATGIVFLAIGLFVAQFVRTSRGANGVSAALVGLAFVLRGVGDALGTPTVDGLHMTSSWLSWLSPIGWGQHVAAFSGDTLLPLVPSLLLATAAGAGALLLGARRDVGSSLLKARASRPQARRSLSTGFALAWRLQWPSIVGWAVGAAAFGLFAGTLSGLIEQATAANPTVADTLRGLVSSDGSVDQALISAMFSIVGVLAAACAVQSVIRLRQEETSGLAEMVLATPVTRVRWLLDYVAVGALAIVIVISAAWIVATAGVLASGDDTAHIGDATVAAAAQLPAALTYLGVLALVFAALPTATVALGWAVLAVGAVLGIFGGIIGAPRWVRDVSPFSHIAALSGNSVAWNGGLWMVVIAAAAAGAAVAFMRRRDLRV
ncbi:ABC transporter permease [Glaciihabitans sp. dw_435]|uniref:ABC transporter permease n=1 Tax=Glaciihabitans sp. dw_435 TaxID=2720081 RepID=UPI001BD1C0EC|nr:hypothetical protein [Glaciihabitans sp. dw_435]